MKPNDSKSQTLNELLAELGIDLKAPSDPIMATYHIRPSVSVVICPDPSDGSSSTITMSQELTNLLCEFRLSPPQGGRRETTEL